MTPDNSAPLPLAQVLPGARLAAAVLGADGQVLMTAGSVLSDAALQSLARRGIVSVVIEAQSSEADLNAAREALRQRLGRVFRRCDMERDSAAQVLFKAVLAYRLEALQ